MSSLREQILSAALTALNTSHPSGVPATVRGRHRNLTPDQLPALSLYPGPEDTVQPVHHSRSPIMQRSLGIVIEAVAAASSGMTADQAVDPLCAWAVKALAGNLFGALATAALEVKTRFRYGVAGKTPVCLARVEFQIAYSSHVNDLERAG